jgi:hypothetical protein
MILFKLSTICSVARQDDLNGCIKKDMKKPVVTYFNLLPQHLPLVTKEISVMNIYVRAAQAVHSAQCAKMCAAQPARVQMMQRHGPACS